MENIIEKIKEFHGHAGVWAAVGYRAGLLAKKRLSYENTKDIEARIEIPYAIPYSCFLDGVQISSCCTIGKKNLSFENSNKIKAFFKNTKSNNKITISLNSNTLNEIKQMEKNNLCTHEFEIENTKWILSKTDEELFNLTSS